jgi:glyoxylase-like metal-dependent hydrolase (beta-lactamase superfamily II)
MKKKVLITFAIAVSFVILIAGAYFIKMNIEIRKMTPIATGEIAPGIYCIKDNFVNMYLIKVADKYIAIDAGIDSKVVTGEMAKLHVNEQDVVAVLLTHTDNDHVGALKLFNSAKIYISDEEEQMINGKTKRTIIGGNSLPYGHENLTDGQVLDINGVSVKGILTPGHTPGSMCYLVDGKYLFIGDTLSIKGGKVALFNEFFNMSTELEKGSIKKLAALTDDIKYVLTAHYGIGSDFKNMFEDWK